LPWTEVAAPTEVQTWRTLTIESVVILLSPIAAWVLLGISLINQDGFVDPWFYTGYGRAFNALHALFEWPYYAVRFPVIILNEAFAWSHPVLGFVALRYILLLACGVPLYWWARRTFGRSVALLSYLFLFCSPLLPRILLWDLTTFVSVPMALAGMGLWLADESGASRLLSGICMTASVAAHAFTGTAVGLFLLVQAVRRIRAGQYWRLVVFDIFMTAVGTMTCLVIGWGYYRYRLGPFDPTLFYTVTVGAAAVGNQYAGAHGTPFIAWAATQQHVYIPVLCVVLAGLLLGRRVLDNTATASVWWFGLLYLIAYVIYQFVFGRFVLETFYYFAHLAITIFLLVPVVVGELLRYVPAAMRRRASVAIAAGLLALPVYNRIALSQWDVVVHASYGSLPALAVLLGGAAVVVLLSIGLRRRPFAGALCAAGFMVMVQLLALVSPSQRSVFDSRRAAYETGVYLAALDMLSVFSRYAQPTSHVMLWYCPSQVSLTSVASTVLLYTVHNSFSGTNEACVGTIGPFERKRLQSLPVRYILMLDQTGASFDTWGASLRQEGYAPREVLSRTIGDEAYSAALRLVAIDRRPQ
jgi:hypothetical protein